MTEHGEAIAVPLNCLPPLPNLSLHHASLLTIMSQFSRSHTLQDVATQRGTVHFSLCQARLPCMCGTSTRRHGCAPARHALSLPTCCSQARHAGCLAQQQDITSYGQRLRIFTQQVQEAAWLHALAQVCVNARPGCHGRHLYDAYFKAGPWSIWEMPGAGPSTAR